MEDSSLYLQVSPRLDKLTYYSKALVVSLQFDFLLDPILFYSSYSVLSSYLIGWYYPSFPPSPLALNTHKVVRMAHIPFSPASSLDAPLQISARKSTSRKSLSCLIVSPFWTATLPEGVSLPKVIQQPEEPGGKFFQSLNCCLQTNRLAVMYHLGTCIALCGDTPGGSGALPQGPGDTITPF